MRSQTNVSSSIAQSYVQIQLVLGQTSEPPEIIFLSVETVLLTIYKNLENGISAPTSVGVELFVQLVGTCVSISPVGKMTTNLAALILVVRIMVESVNAVQKTKSHRARRIIMTVRDVLQKVVLLRSLETVLKNA